MLPPDGREQRSIAAQLLGCQSLDNATDTTFKAYFDYYNTVICPSTPNDTVLHISTPALSSHMQVLQYSRSLCANPHITRNELIKASPNASSTLKEEQEHVARSIVSVTFMIDCASGRYYSQGFGRETQPRARWETDQPFLHFVKQALGVEFGRSVDQWEKIQGALDEKKLLKAWKLVRRCGIKLRPTDNLVEHLQYEPKEKILKIFHHVAFLRAALRKTKGKPLDLDFEQSIPLGTLPPRLLFETLVSFHSILFPIAGISSKRSTKLLEKLIRTRGFDPECMWVEFVRPITPDFEFMYWGDRIARLHELVKQPPPRNRLVSWIERHTSERNALTVAIVGLFLAALFGLLSLLVGIVQTVIAFLAWKYPRA